jgi:hypothetical protein
MNLLLFSRAAMKEGWSKTSRECTCELNWVINRITNMKRSYYSNSISQFLTDDPQVIYGQLAVNSDFAVEQNQKNAWVEQIEHLKSQ